jgi:hypothetical protein
MGKWDESMSCIIGDDASKVNSRNANQSTGATLLWEKNVPPANPTRYNLSSFAITLNELTPGLKEKLPPTDSRLRPDQRHLENGEYEKANSEKLRLETRQRMVSILVLKISLIFFITVFKFLPASLYSYIELH